MKRTLSIIALISLAVLSYATSAQAQGEHTHRHDPSEKLGMVNFRISCNPQAQKQFNRSVAWLHSFEYEEAEKAFTEETKIKTKYSINY